MKYKKMDELKSLKDLNFMLVHEAFEKDGWQMYHKFMAGNKWVKGNDTVTCYYGVYKMNGKAISKEELCDMLHIDRRALQVCEAIAPHEIHGKYGRTFLAGVRWADAHPICK